jgi:hypothetical protein
MTPHVITDEEILEAARKIYRQKGWFTSRDIYAELVQGRCPKYEDRPLSLRRISVVLQKAGAQTTISKKKGYSQFIIPETT